MTIERLCQPIRMILSDVDGVLTDGGIILDNQGIETKRFHVRDGQGIKLWQKAGYQFGLITLRSSQLLKIRTAELGIEIVRQGIEEKKTAVRQVIADHHLKPEQVCYIGDDLPDLPVLREVGLSVTVADACEELRKAADYTTHLPGGCGAVREAIELILKFQGRWADVIRQYTSA